MRASINPSSIARAAAAESVESDGWEGMQWLDKIITPVYK